MRVAYLVNQYPKVSHTFIRREILALERLGFTITRIALRGWDERLVDDEDILERLNTHYVLQSGALALLGATVRLFIARPHRFLRALSSCWRLGRRAERPFIIHLIYLAEACHVVLQLRRAMVQHLHAHFGTNSAEVALLVHALGGPPWSFTVHGPEEFDKAKFIGISEKVKRCAFVVAISSFGRSQLFRNIGHEYWEKVHVVHCGLDLQFHSVRSEYHASRRFICVGRLCEQKGQLLLVESARRLSEIGVEFELILAGDGEMRPQIERLIKLYNLDSKIRLTVWISSGQVRQ
jgi:colanic acid/amylovoran biosynthesis glycosyltransferase